MKELKQLNAWTENKKYVIKVKAQNYLNKDSKDSINGNSAQTACGGSCGSACGSSCSCASSCS